MAVKQKNEVLLGGQALYAVGRGSPQQTVPELLSNKENVENRTGISSPVSFSHLVKL